VADGDVRLSGDVIDTSTPLYAKLLGGAWSQLAEPIRAFHAKTPTQARGRMRLVNGGGVPARALNWLLRLPAASESADVRLHVDRERDGERWCRTFNGARVTTWQRAGAANLLVERFGFFEIQFQLVSENGALRYRQTDASMRIGALRLRLPAAIAPAVEGCERPCGPACIDVQVSVSWPPAGLILAYDGAIHFENRAA